MPRIEWGKALAHKRPNGTPSFEKQQVAENYDFTGGEIFEADGIGLLPMLEQEYNDTERWLNAVRSKIYAERSEVRPTYISINLLPLTKLDLNNDGVLNDADIDVFAAYMFSQKGDPNYVEWLDFNRDDRIDIRDRVYYELYVNEYRDQPLYHGAELVRVEITVQAEGEGIAGWAVSLIIAAVLLVLGAAALWQGINFAYWLLVPLRGADAPDPPTAPDPEDYDFNNNDIIDPSEYEQFLKDYRDYLDAYHNYKEEFPRAGLFLIILIFALLAAATLLGSKYIEGRR